MDSLLLIAEFFSLVGFRVRPSLFLGATTVTQRLPSTVAKLPAEKSLIPRLLWMRDMMKSVGIGFVRSKYYLADVMTKPHASFHKDTHFYWDRMVRGEQFQVHL